MSANCNLIVIFFIIYDQFEAIRKPDSRRIVCKTYISIIVIFHHEENCKQNQK